MSGADALGQERQEFYRSVSSEIATSIKARVNIRAFDSLGTAWRGNDDGVSGETDIFPAGHSDRFYVTGINPGWNAEQSIVYRSITCFARVKGAYSAVWTIDWRDSQDATPTTGLTGLAKIIGFEPQRIDNKFIQDELLRVRGYAVYRLEDGDSPWYSDFFDNSATSIAKQVEDSKQAHVFRTLQAETTYLAHS